MSEGSRSEIARLQAEVERLQREIARREAEVAPRLAVLAAIEASRAHRLWMASIRVRRALRPRRRAPTADRPARLRRELEREGFVAPLRIWAPEACRQILERLRADPPPPGEWGKDLAVTSRAMYEIATCEAVRRPVVAVLGDDVVLWGASLVERPPGAVHPWHTDIESSSPAGGFASLWIGLENVGRETSLRAVRRSHRFGAPLQEVASEHGRRRGEAPEDEIAAWALRRDRRGRIVGIDCGVGEAILFDGRLWHGSRNETAATRTALLLQYARASTPVRLADFSALEWPFRWLDEPRPRCLLVSGSAPAPEVNRIVPPPPAAPRPRSLPIEARQLELSLAPDPQSGWKPYPQFQGSSANVRELSCHVSALAPASCPHPPHRHPEEELLVLLSGAAELVLADETGEERSFPVHPGCFSYYPAQQLHTLRTPPGRSALYLMLKWVGDPSRRGPALPAGVYRCDEQAAAAEAAAAPFAARTLFEGPTGWLDTLHGHVSAVAPGGGYDAHVDAHDVALVVLSGTIEVAGRRVAEPGIVFVPAGEPHDLHNPGAATARYLVFEFHGPAGA